MADPGDARASARIDLDALRANLATAREAAAGRRVIAVVKADAYGHGAARVGCALEAAGADALAVLNVAEGAALRDAGVTGPCLVLAGLDSADEAGEARARDLTPVLHHAGQLEAARGASGSGAAWPVHVEVDTGMRRMGVPPEEADAFVAAVAEAPGIALAGLMTHFARADEPDLAASRAQLESFRGVIDRLAARGLRPAWVHAANSAGLLAGEPLADACPAIDAVRPGLMLYGVRPAPHFAGALRPVMTLEARVVALRRVAAGEAVGYGGTWRAPRPTRVATLGLGYADGLPVAASGQIEVGLGGRRCALVGRVSMDSVGADVGDAPVVLGDRAVVFGAGGPTVEEQARAIGTIPYELLVRVGARVLRVPSE